MSDPSPDTPNACPTCRSTQPAARHTGRWWRLTDGTVDDSRHGPCPDEWHACPAARSSPPDYTALADELRNAILDIDAHATPFGTDDDGFVSGGYLISVGSLHRALGVVGHSAAKCGGCRNCWTLDQWKAEEQLLRDELEAQAARITELEQLAVTVVRRSRRYRRDERHEFDPGPCPDCGATGRFTVTWIAASISGEDPAEYAVPGTVTCTAATHDHPNQESL